MILRVRASSTAAYAGRTDASVVARQSTSIPGKRFLLMIVLQSVLASSVIIQVGRVFIRRRHRILRRLILGHLFVRELNPRLQELLNGHASRLLECIAERVAPALAKCF